MEVRERISHRALVRSSPASGVGTAAGCCHGCCHALVATLSLGNASGSVIGPDESGPVSDARRG